MQICYIPPKQSKYVQIEDKELTFQIRDCHRFMKYMAGLLGLAITQINTYADTTEILSKVNATGLEAFGICKGLGFWGAVILMVIDIIKSIKKEDISGIIRICIKYSVWYATIYFAPEIVMLVVNLFK